MGHESARADARNRTGDASPGHPRPVDADAEDSPEHQPVEDALRRSEARLEAGARLAGLAYYEVDYGGGHITIDDRFRELCGVPSDLDLGLQPVEFWHARLHPEDLERVEEVRRQLHDGRLEQISTEYRFNHPTRGEIWVHHLAGVATRDDAGRAVVTYGVLRDITPRKHMLDDLRDLSRRLIVAHEEERALIARELHDDITQRLAVLAIEAGRAEHLAHDQEHVQALGALREGLSRLSEDVHALAYRLHPSILSELGLGEALRAETDLCQRRGGFALSVDIAQLPADLERDTALCLFRVAQEALQNVRRHARARTASLVLRPLDGGLLLAVRDDGEGFDPGADRQGRNLGLASMRERVSLLRGTLDVESAPGLGTEIVAWVPLQGNAR